jgi:hypothetical protein
MPSVGATPESSPTAAEKAATVNWLAKTNEMWTGNDFICRRSGNNRTDAGHLPVSAVLR